MSFLSGPVTPNDTWRMEQFSKAYVKAVASASGCAYHEYHVDIDAVDIGLKRRTGPGPRRSPQIDVQLKSTFQSCLQSDCVAYPLDVPTYNKLRSPDYAVPRILVVLLVHTEFERWLAHSEDELRLFRCAYWASLRGEPETTNSSNITVRIPRTQVFDAVGLDAIFNRVANAGYP